MIPIAILSIENENDRVFMTDLFIQYERLFLSEALQIVHDPWEAEDVLQTTIVKLIDKLQLLRSMEERPRVNYMITAVKNTAYSAMRRKSRDNMPSVDDDEWYGRDSISSDDSIETDVFRAEMLNGLNEIWQDLDWRSQYLLNGRYILNTPSRELAEELGIKPDSIRMELSRARKKARALMEDQHNFTEMWDR